MTPGKPNGKSAQKSSSKKENALDYFYKKSKKPEELAAEEESSEIQFSEGSLPAEQFSVHSQEPI